MNQTIVKGIRHGLAAIAGYIIPWGVEIDPSDTTSLCVGLLLFAASYIWSVYSKDPITKEGNDKLKMLFTAFVQQGLAALAGYLQATGQNVDVADPAAVILFGGNLGLSRILRRDVKMPSVEELQRTGLLLFAALFPFWLVCCKSVPGQVDSPAMSFGKDLAMMAGQMAIDRAQAALEAEMLKPKPDAAKIASLQLGVLMARQQLDNARARRALPLPAVPSTAPPINPVLPEPDGKAVLDERLW